MPITGPLMMENPEIVAGLELAKKAGFKPKKPRKNKTVKKTKK